MTATNVVALPGTTLTPAQQKLVQENLRVVDILVKRHRKKAGRTLSLEDLVAAGHVGLVKAAARYDEGRGVQFMTFAWDQVEGAIVDFIDRERPRARFHAALRRGLADFAQTPPKIRREKLDPFESDEEMRRHALAASFHLADSLFLALAAFQNKNPEEHVVEHAQAEAVRKAITHLEDRRQKLIEKRYYEEQPMDEVAQELGISQETARRWQRESTEKLEKLLDAQGWKPRRAVGER